MSHQIFPSSITEFSSENLINKHSAKSKAIYWILIVTILLLVLSMFWVKVDVNIHSSGIITSEERATTIIAPVFGRIKLLNIKENDYVIQGDTLLIIDTGETQNNINIILERIHLLEQQNMDLAYLTSFTKNNYKRFSKLTTALYKQESQKFIAELHYQKSETAILEKDYLRQKLLFNKGIVPVAAYEQVSYKYKSSILKFNKLFAAQLADWQNRHNQNNTLVYNLKESLNHLQKENDKHFITASINGYVQNLTGVKSGGNIYPNQEICRITPTTDLIVETYVSSTDIGFIKPNQKVRVRVDAFNYNQWGMLEGQVKEIANDISIPENGMPSFKIRCTLHNTRLNYKDKTTSVKKGMTVNTNFLLTRRTIAQLLYDNITDWMDPNKTEKTKVTSNNLIQK